MIRSKKAFVQYAAYGLIIVILFVFVYIVLAKDKVNSTSTPPNPQESVKVSPPPATTTLVQDCPVGYVKQSDGTCKVVNPQFTQPEAPEAPCEVTGYFKSAYVWSKSRVGSVYAQGSSTVELPRVSYQFVLTNDCEALFYVESGVVEQTSGLTILVSTPSACDGNSHFAGKYLTGSKNTKFSAYQPAGVLDVSFYPKDYGKEQNLRALGGVYTSCLNKGGKTVAEVSPQTISVKNSYSDTEITNGVAKII
jgi:hypothetical protein